MDGLDPAIFHRIMCVGRQITGSGPVMTISGRGPGLHLAVVYLSAYGFEPGDDVPACGDGSMFQPVGLTRAAVRKKPGRIRAFQVQSAASAPPILAASTGIRAGRRDNRCCNFDIYR